MKHQIGTKPQAFINSLGDLGCLIGDHTESSTVWQQLSNSTIALNPSDHQQTVTMDFNFSAQSVKADRPVTVSKAVDAKARLFVTGGGIRLTDNSQRAEFVKSGDQIDLGSSTELRIDPVAGFGDASFVCVCEGATPEFAPFSFPADEEPVEAPYYWGYDRRYAQTYEEGGLTWETTDANQIVMELIPELISNKDTDAIIDLGCGEGRDSLWLASQGYSVTGVDVSSAALNRARELAGDQGVSPVFFERDVVFLRGLEAETYSVALNMGCLHMLDSDEDREGHLKRVFEILKPGGTFVINHCKED